MQFYNLGLAPWEDVHAIVCALAELRREGAVLAQTNSPCVCAGGRIHLDQDVDLDFCRAHGIPIFRRETRSRAICLAGRQLELQLVTAHNSPLLSPIPADNCLQILGPLLQTCRVLGVEAAYKPPAEIAAGDRRIASACVGQVHESTVLAASLILDFDPELFVNVLKIQDADLRERVAELVRRRRTSLKQELGDLPLASRLESCVIEQLELVVGALEIVAKDTVLTAQMRDSAAAMFSRFRQHALERIENGWQLEVGAGTELQQCAYKAPGGFLRATCEWRYGRIVRASLSGDFFSFPQGALFRLEQSLVGVRQDQVERKLEEIYARLGLVTPGVHAAHWAKVLHRHHA